MNYFYNKKFVLIMITAGVVAAFAGAIVTYAVTKAVTKEKSPVLYSINFSTERMWYDENGGVTAIGFESTDGAKHCVTITSETVTISPVYEIDGSIQIKKELEE